MMADDFVTVNVTVTGALPAPTGMFGHKRLRKPSKPYHKHPEVLTDQRTKQAAKDFAYYGVPMDVAPLPPVGGDRWAGVPRLFGMPNSHCPGTIAIGMLGGRVIRHSQTPGDYL